MSTEALRLKVRRIRTADERPFIPRQAEPSHPVKNALDHFVRRPLDIGVLNAQHEDAAMTTSEQEVEEGRAGAADMKVARRGRGKSNARRLHRSQDT